MIPFEKIAAKAESLRERANALSIPINLERMLSYLRVEIDERPLEDEFSGVLISGKKPAVVVVNSLHSQTRRRFTVAHELGHYVLHSRKKDGLPVFIDKTEVYFRSNAHDQENYDSIKEMEANAFAAEILMPKQLLKEYIKENDLDISKKLGIQALAQEFEVSQQAMEYRLRNTGLIIQMG